MWNLNNGNIQVSLSVKSKKHKQIITKIFECEKVQRSQVIVFKDRN